MNLLNIPFSREKVAKVFKERFGLAYANSMTKLILFQNGKLAWFYSAASGPQKAICLGKDQFRLLKTDEKLPSYRVIGKDEYFYIGKNIYQCRCFIKNQMLIKKVSEVLRAEDARMIMKSEKEPNAYKIIQTDGSVSNIIWKISPNENAAFVFAFLEGCGICLCIFGRRLSLQQKMSAYPFGICRRNHHRGTSLDVSYRKRTPDSP